MSSKFLKSKAAERWDDISMCTYTRTAIRIEKSRPLCNNVIIKLPKRRTKVGNKISKLWTAGKYFDEGWLAAMCVLDSG